MTTGVTLTLFRIAPGELRTYAHHMHEEDCKTCLIAHDEEIHEATLRLHQWLQDPINSPLSRSGSKAQLLGSQNG